MLIEELFKHFLTMIWMTTDKHSKMKEEAKTKQNKQSAQQTHTRGEKEKRKNTDIYREININNLNKIFYIFVF